MSLWTISEIKSALKNKTEEQLISIGKINNKINQVVIDSRAKTDNGLFVAISGKNNDGHNFLSQAFENGCVCALVEKIPDNFSGDERLILVKNSAQALNQLAIFSRNRSKTKIIAVTGSVGKTSVKEMLSLVFSSQGKTFATAGNLNNNFGLPLSLANMPATSEFGIFEMGMNHSGEIGPLSKIARPHLAIITTVNSAHIGNFNNEEEIALAKSEIFSGVESNGFAVINNDNKHFNFIKEQALKNHIPAHNIINFGSKETSNFRILSAQKINNELSKVEVFISSEKKRINYSISSINQAVIFNSLIAVSCLYLLGKNFDVGLQTLENLSIPSGRGNLIKVNKNNIEFTIIDDSYNANLSSMQSGLKFLSDLKNINPGAKTIAFLGDMLELGEQSQSEHKAIANYISECNIDSVLLVGDFMQNLIVDIAPKKLIGHFQNSLVAAEQMQFQPQNGDIIFVKGSRGMKMERLIEKLK